MYNLIKCTYISNASQILPTFQTHTANFLKMLSIFGSKYIDAICVTFCFHPVIMQHSEYGDEFEEVMFGTIKLIRRNNQTIQDSIQCPEIRYGVGDHIPAPTSGSVC